MWSLEAILRGSYSSSCMTRKTGSNSSKNVLLAITYKWYSWHFSDVRPLFSRPCHWHDSCDTYKWYCWGVFCSTSVPLAGTWWVWSSLSSLCALSSYQGSQLSSATSWVLKLWRFCFCKNSWNCWDPNPGQLGLSAQTPPLWYAITMPWLLSFLRFDTFGNTKQFL